MPLESGTFIGDLVITNPVGATDHRRFGDDHLRLIKEVLKNTFPVATKAFYFPRVVQVVANTGLVSADNNKIFDCAPGGLGSITLTLPVLGASDAGWGFWVCKTGSATDPIFIQRAVLETINGFAKIRRSIRYAMTEVRWTGSEYVATRPAGAPIGSVIRFDGTVSPPNGYLAANGGLFSSTDFPELHSVLGGLGVLPNVAGHIVVAE